MEMLDIFYVLNSMLQKSYLSDKNLPRILGFGGVSVGAWDSDGFDDGLDDDDGIVVGC
jgi:hypothetical protein